MDSHILSLTYMIEIFLFLKFKEFINELGKTFSIGEKWDKTIENSSHTTKYLAKRPWKYIFLAYAYKSIELVNKLKKLKC